MNRFKSHGEKIAHPARATRLLSLALAAAVLAGCAVQIQNRQPAQEMARQAQPPGSVYAGWRVFQDKCAGCHGPAATGTANAPDLIPRLRQMGPNRFVELVLRRYDWQLPPDQVGQVDDVVQRRQGALTMPAWQDEPRVNAHIVDLYAYLQARSEGTQGPGRPSR